MRRINTFHPSPLQSSTSSLTFVMNRFFPFFLFSLFQQKDENETTTKKVIYRPASTFCLVFWAFEVSIYIFFLKFVWRTRRVARFSINTCLARGLFNMHVMLTEYQMLGSICDCKKSDWITAIDRDMSFTLSATWTNNWQGFNADIKKQLRVLLE